MADTPIDLKETPATTAAVTTGQGMPLKANVAVPSDLRADLVGNCTTDAAPNCPKVPKCTSSICKKLPGGTVQCEYCHIIFKP